MMTSSRPRDVGGSFASRRGHAPQLSISDPSHHVTEAIGTLYGDDDDSSGSPSDSRHSGFLDSPYAESPQSAPAATPIDGRDRDAALGRYGPRHQPHHNDPRRQGQVGRSMSEGTTGSTTASATTNGNHPFKKAQTVPARMPSQRSGSFEHGNPKSPMSPMSPTLSLRDVQAADSSNFPLTNIDNPNDIAQELSNLQALRRMSMNVENTADPDLLPFQGMSLMAMPSIAPKGDDDEADPSRLLWVPARVHPELAPMEFKTFLEKRVNLMRRRSGESTLSVDSIQRSNSGLRRKKSMLSRQVDSGSARGGEDYTDAADRLERQRSLNGHYPPELSLDELVKDPTKVVQQLAQESQRQELGGERGSLEDDMPILPVAPGMGLRRSTRTQYRKGGSLRSGDRLPFAKRVAARHAESGEGDESAASSPIEPPPRGHTLARVQSEPISENFSRPKQSVRRRGNFSREGMAPVSSPDGFSQDVIDSPVQSSPINHDQLPIRTSSAEASRSSPIIPQIIETPPFEDDEVEESEPDPTQVSRPFPVRSSSQKAAEQMSAQQPINEPPPRSSKRVSPGRTVQVPPIQTQQLPPQTPPAPQPQQPPQQPVQQPAQQSPQQSSLPLQQQEPPQRQQQQPQSPASKAPATLNDIAQNPSPLPGSGSTRTDSLTFIPTLPAEERKLDKKAKKDRDDAESISSVKSTTWKWLTRGGDEKKKKEEEVKKKGKSFAEKAQESARLDVLQTSIDNGATKGRESIAVERENTDKLAEERKREAARKAAEPKKEKDGLFATIFGSKGRKGDKDSYKKAQRALSPDPPNRQLRPDIDYPWTRFTLLEERAIYRMAHIKLANPRRPLYSQVLLSNFMYAYLAKIQAMHPQIQVPQSPQQKRLEEERRRKEEAEQQAYMEQQMQQQAAQDNMDQYNFEYHRDGGNNNQYSEQPSNEGVHYVDDSQIYEYDHGIEDGHDHSPIDRGDGYGRQGGRDYYNYGRARSNDNRYNHHDGEDDDDMW